MKDESSSGLPVAFLLHAECPCKATGKQFSQLPRGGNPHVKAGEAAMASVQALGVLPLGYSDTTSSSGQPVPASR